MLPLKMAVSPAQTIANMGCGPTAQLQPCEAADTPQAPQLSAQHVQHNHCQGSSFAEAVEEYHKLVAQNRIEEHELVLRHREQEAQFFRPSACFPPEPHRGSAAHPQPEPEVLSTDTIEKEDHSDKPMFKNSAQKTIIIDLGSESEDEVDEPTGGVSNKTNNTPQHVQPIESVSKSTPAAKTKNSPDDATNPTKRYVRRPRRLGQWWSVPLEEWERLSEREKQKRSEVGWAMETHAGMTAILACSHCKKLGHECRVEARPVVGKDGVIRPRPCAYCFFHPARCSFLDLPHLQDTTGVLPALQIPAARPSLKRARPPSPALQATDMKKEPDGPQREDYKDNMTVPTRSSTAVTHSRSSNDKKLRRISIDLTGD